MNVRTKFEFRSFTHSWDNRGTPKIWAVPGYAHAPFSPIFSCAFVRMDPVNVPAKFEVRIFTLPVPEIIAIAILGWGCEPPILGKGRP